MMYLGSSESALMIFVHLLDDGQKRKLVWSQSGDPAHINTLFGLESFLEKDNLQDMEWNKWNKYDDIWIFRVRDKVYTRLK